MRHLSDLATEREIHEFFSFSGEIELVEIPQQRYVYRVRVRDFRCQILISNLFYRRIISEIGSMKFVL